MRRQEEDIQVRTEQIEPEVLLPQVADGEALPTVAKWGGWRQRLPRFSDEGQRRAGKNLLRFFALVLVLTLVARGTAGATLPRVETERPAAGEIVQKVRGTGTVKGSGSTTLEVPEGLTVEQVDASPGQSVAPGDVLARFDVDEVNAQWQRETNALEELRLKLRQLQRGEAHDGSALEAARQKLERTRQDYDIARAQAEADLAAARQALADAESAERQAKAYLEGIADTASPEYQAAHAEWTAKVEEVTLKREALAKAQTQADAALLAAGRALEDAQSALAAAERDDAEARQKAQDTVAQNKLEASTLELDIEAQQEKVALLQALLENEGQLCAGVDGVVQALPQPGAKTGAENSFRLSLASGGYEAEMWLDKKDAEKLAPGDTCEVTLSGGSAYYRPTAQGVVVAVGTAGEDGRAKVTVRLPDEEWKLGQTVEVQVVQERQSHSLCVPLSAIHSSSEGYYVLVLREQSTVLGLEYVAAKVPVTIKAQDEQNAAIEGALSDREDIITGSNKAVQPDDKVRVET